MKLLMENWRKFLNEDISLNEQLKKADLPFIKKFLALKDLPLDQYVQGLKKIAGNPGFRKVATAGQTDAGGAPDEAVTTGLGKKKASELLPTQKDIGFTNSLKDQVTNPPWKPVNAILSGETVEMGNPPGPILTYKGKYILDGHHRWSQVMMMNPEAEMSIADISGAALGDAEEALKATQLAIAAYSGKLKTKPLGGPDLMQASAEAVKKYVIQNITDDVLQLMTQAGKIPEPKKELAAEYFAKTLALIQSRQGPFDRETSMPQADHTGGKGTQKAVNALLGKGAINFDDPQPKDVKKTSRE